MRWLTQFQRKRDNTTRQFHIARIFILRVFLVRPFSEHEWRVLFVDNPVFSLSLSAANEKKKNIEKSCNATTANSRPMIITIKYSKRPVPLSFYCFICLRLHLFFISFFFFHLIPNKFEPICISKWPRLGIGRLIVHKLLIFLWHFQS